MKLEKNTKTIRVKFHKLTKVFPIVNKLSIHTMAKLMNLMEKLMMLKLILMKI